MADLSAVVLTKGIDLLYKIVEKNGGKLLGVAADSATKLKEALAINFSAYFEDAVDRCSRVAILFDRSKSAKLSSLYVRSYLEYAQITVPDTKFRNLIATLPAKDSRRTFLVIASAGSGKTFLMKWLFLNILENESSRIPFFVELRGLNYKPNTDLLRFLYDTIVARRARISFESFQSGMKQGEFIFLLDGLDEVEHDRRDSLKGQILRMQEEYPGIILVITSRPDESLNSWMLARHYSLLPFNKKAVLALIGKLPYKRDVRAHFMQEVNLNLYDQHQSFMSNPLLITIMLLTYGDLGKVPAKMHIFYEQAYETLFYRHDTWKEAGFQRKHYCSLPVNEFRDCLSALCISSYKKMRYEFTTSAALELIKAAADFERIDVDPSAFLNDLVESVCLLQVDGLMYRFTHRSFQEYFAAVFITRGPAIDLGALLDNLAARRSDVVIPMAVDMNRNLIEKEWVLPGVRSIASMVPDTPFKTLAFAEHVFGKVSYDGTRRNDQLMVGEPPSPVLTRLAYFKDLYPKIITKLDGLIGLSHDDREKVRLLWQQLCAQWWENNREKLKADNSWKPTVGGKWPYANDVFLTAYQQVVLDGKSSLYRKTQATSANGKERAIYEAFVEDCNHKFYQWQAGRRSLVPDRDAEWFSVTSNAGRLIRLGEEVIALSKHIESSLDYSRLTGTKLLD